MSTNPLQPKSIIKEEKFDNTKKNKPSEISYDFIVKGYEWFKHNRDFKNTDMYDRINNINQYIQI